MLTHTDPLTSKILTSFLLLLALILLKTHSRLGVVHTYERARQAVVLYLLQLGYAFQLSDVDVKTFVA